jgi:signal transduction histidine kinase
MCIRDRVYLLDGSLEIQSEIGKGTRLLISIPDVRKEVKHA